MTSSPFYYRWRAFFDLLQRCIAGVRLESREHLRSFLASQAVPLVPGHVIYESTDLFVVDFESMRVVQLSPYLRETGEIETEEIEVEEPETEEPQ